MIASDSAVHYTVRQGDWLSKIAPRFGESWQQLYADNRQVVGSNPDLICPGMVLRVGHRTAVVRGRSGSASAVSHTAEAKSSTSQTTRGAVAVAYARSKIGSHYRWGATGPNVFDCSGLVYAAWRHAGVTLPRTTDEMWHHLPRVSMSHLRVGDIIAFGYHSSYADHVGIYAGNGWVIDTSSHRPHGAVGIQSLKSRTGGGAWHVLGAVRPAAASSMTARSAATSTRAASRRTPMAAAASAARGALPVDPIWFGTLYQDRFGIFCQRLMDERLYDAVCYVTSSADEPYPFEPVEGLDWRHFAAAINARLSFLRDLGIPGATSASSLF
ncbi:NlpC/P60 family protein [Streptomyces sp. CA-142005]|uniref:C40 family peptidase n=1 Tax=Streptomyces sp. CA-142005 TaxID=3240052 RepID=UPI003D8C1860